MRYYLGIDIGTFESKGVLSDEEGRIVASAARPHRMLVPQPGWAEHDAEQNWWGEFCSISRELIEKAQWRQAIFAQSRPAALAHVCCQSMKTALRS